VTIRIAQELRLPVLPSAQLTIGAVDRDGMRLALASLDTASQAAITSPNASQAGAAALKILSKGAVTVSVRRPSEATFRPSDLDFVVPTQADADARSAMVQLLEPVLRASTFVPDGGIHLEMV
jgi:hypothetical protein